MNLGGIPKTDGEGSIPPGCTAAAVIRHPSPQKAGDKRRFWVGWESRENVKPIETPLTFAAVKLYRDF